SIQGKAKAQCSTQALVQDDNILNYFINRSTNASAESLNSKLKSFRAQVRGVTDLPFFMYRVGKIYG
ncbi:MAG: transposase, partial [Candidatus Cryptobacteroides sp.]